jgi:glyoxylase-like metal-dependent hydrolase (beta-lactamase superfamily II)
MIFRQLFDPETSTYTYLLADESTREAVLIDPVREQVARDAGLVHELGLTLRFTLETHVHADHITGASLLRAQLGSQAAVGAAAGVACADRALADGAELRIGSLTLRALATPGHTNGCTSYACAAAGMAFTGDALLIRGCGRTDFQQGNARRLFRSVRERLFTLPDATLLYPGHDYRGRTVTTVAEEKRWNPRLGLARSEDEFVAIMAALRLDYPKRMDESVPANLQCGSGPVPPSHQPAVANLVAAQSGRQDGEVDLGAGI